MNDKVLVDDGQGSLGVDDNETQRAMLDYIDGEVFAVQASGGEPLRVQAVRVLPIMDRPGGPNPDDGR